VHIQTPSPPQVGRQIRQLLPTILCTPICCAQHYVMALYQICGSTTVSRRTPLHPANDPFIPDIDVTGSGRLIGFMTASFAFWLSVMRIRGLAGESCFLKHVGDPKQ
jgi:hypothetical protein